MDIVVLKGKFGPYLKFGDKNISLPRGTDPMTVSLEQCLSLIEEKSGEADPSKPLLDFQEVAVMNGRYGPYLKADGRNYRLPKGIDVASLTKEKCLEIVAGSEPTRSGRKSYRKKK